MSFVPSDEQRDFRAHARTRLDDHNEALIGQWARAHEVVTVRDWDQWTADDGFMDWWSEAFPEHAGITVADLRMLDFQGHKALAQGLLSGDQRAVGTWARMKQVRDEANDLNKQAEKRKALRALLEDGDPLNDPELATGWYAGPEAQAR